MFDTMNLRENYPRMEEEILNSWEKKQIFERLRDLIKNHDKFVFLEGPPTANGMPHLGHALTRASKDLVLRYNAMLGKQIFPWIAGWDCHGLPVELEIEKSLHIHSKREIEQYGIEKFNNLCKISIFKYKKEWENMSRRIGFWIDFENAYITMADTYIESEWWALKQLWNKNLLKKDYKVVPYCPRCGTPLSSHEVAQGYKETEDPSVYVKFKVIGEENAYFLVWTTTPWTLPSNLLLAINAHIEYAQVLYQNEKYYIAKDLVKKVLKQNYKIIRTVKGTELLRLRYERLIPEIEYNAQAFYVVHGSFVSLDEGTGIVHCAPAFGADDFVLGKAENLPILNPVNTEGKFNAGPWKNMHVKDADKKIIEYLKSKNRLFRAGKITHIYPFCWRCDTPLLYYAIETWTIQVSKIQKDLIANNDQIHWIPGHLKYGRFGNFLKEAKDWALSRNRYWGTPLPIWHCKNNHYKIIGSFEELKRSAVHKIQHFDPHRPYVDEIILKCDKCGELMYREPYTIDVWFDSGSAPFAQYHYPFENQELFKNSFPVDFITEAIDMTRGWFYTLHTISTMLFNSPAFKNVYTLGFVLNKSGEKMSKSKGDVLSPELLFSTVGADAVRLYFYATPMWKNKKVDLASIKEYRAKTLDILWNVYLFFANNAKLDQFTPAKHIKFHNVLDLWLMSKLNSLIISVRKALDRYEPHKAVSAIEVFIGLLSNWYLRRSRRRFWEEKMSTDKIEAYNALYLSLVTLAKVLAPFTPFIADKLYINLTARDSVHLERYPVPDQTQINKNLEKDMNLAIRVTELARRARQLANIKLRQPLDTMWVYTASPDSIKKMQSIIADEVNVKKLIVTDRPFNAYVLKVDLNYKMVGPKFKNRVTQLKNLLETTDPVQIVEHFKKHKELQLEEFIITEEDIIINKSLIPGYVTQAEKNLEITITTKIDETLYLEGLAREVLRRIQMMRKDLDLEYSEPIITHVVTDDTELVKAINRHMDYIKSETLSKYISYSDIDGFTKTWKIGSKMIKIIIKKILKSAEQP